MDDSQNDLQLAEDQKVQTTGQAEVVVSLGEMIKSTIYSLDNLQTELKKLREMYEDGFGNDPVYREHADKAKDAAKIKNETKQQINKQPQIAQLSAKIRSMSSEVKEKKLSLSEYLLEYQRMTGVNEIETKDGEVRDIVNEARVVKKASKR